MMEAVVAVSILSTSLCTLWLYYWPSLNRRYRPHEVDSVEERCYHLTGPRRLFGGRHCYLVATTFLGDQTRLEYNDCTGQTKVQDHYYDGWPDECYRRRNARTGLYLSDVATAFRKRVEVQAYDPKSYCCQHITRDTLNDISGLEERELRTERLQLIAHFQGPQESLLGGKEIYAHRINLSNSPYSPLTQPKADSTAEPKDEDTEPDRPFMLDLLYELDDFRSIE